jgi:hypothetical protein
MVLTLIVVGPIEKPVILTGTVALIVLVVKVLLNALVPPADPPVEELFTTLSALLF